MRRHLAWLVGVLLAFGAGATSNAWGGAGEGKPEPIIRRTVDEAFTILKNKQLAGKEHRGERLTELRAVADRTFDWAEMARASLGSPWRTMDPGKRQKFVAVFKDVLAARYMDDINRFEGTETVSVDGASRDGDDWIVRTTLVTGSRERVPIDYRMKGAGDRWSIVDISIEGVSLVNHYRKTFQAALVNMTVDQLIDKLNKQLPAASRK